MSFRKYASAIGADSDYSTTKKNGAIGKYGFSWLYHKGDIQKITGVKTRQEFLNDPEAQDKYFEWHTAHNIQPAMDRIKAENSGVDDVELAGIIHRRGEKGAKQWLKDNPIAPQHAVPAEVPDPIEQVIQPTPVEPTYSYEHEDRYGIVKNLHKGRPLSQDELDLALNKSRNVIYQPQATGDIVSVRPGYYDDLETVKAKQEAEWAGMNDPTKNINYKPPVEQIVQPTPTPDPNFPTRDPITGRVTPAANKRFAQVVDDDGVRRILNGIFGNDSEGNPIAHVH